MDGIERRVQTDNVCPVTKERRRKWYLWRFKEEPFLGRGSHVHTAQE
jgi:hypothetical protein